MSFKRRVLSALGKDVLLEIDRGLELDVTTRMGVEELRDALAKSKRAKLDAIAQESLSRDTLKDICGAVGNHRGTSMGVIFGTDLFLVERSSKLPVDQLLKKRVVRPVASGTPHTLQVFAFADDYSFGIIQSSLHSEWIKAKGGKVRADTRYTSEVWRTFPWPQDPTEAQVVAVADAARRLRRVRAELMDQSGWTLRALYQAAEVDGPHPLKDAQATLDAAVADAYGIPPDQGPIEFLLELNQLVIEDEQQGRKVRGPGLSDHLDPKDPRWFSTDCIEPSPVGS